MISVSIIKCSWPICSLCWLSPGSVFTCLTVVLGFFRIWMWMQRNLCKTIPNISLEIEEYEILAKKFLLSIWSECFIMFPHWHLIHQILQVHSFYSVWRNSLLLRTILFCIFLFLFLFMLSSVQLFVQTLYCLVIWNALHERYVTVNWAEI